MLYNTAMFSTDWLGILAALTAALVWGGGDFSGGLATRQNGPFHVLVLSALSGIVLLAACMVVWREPFPSLANILWAALAGGSGAMGIAALYRALSLGNTATIAPTAAVVGAALPVIFGMFTEGMPGITRLAGLGLALAGIWLVSRATNPRQSRPSFGLAWLAGIGFAGFFILLSQVERGTLFGPLLVARCVSLGVALLWLWLRRMPPPSLHSNPIALLAGLLDTGGNVFYLLAKQFTRLDVAVALSAMYPAATIVLARIILQEKGSRRQWLGAVVCLVAIGLIAI